MKYVRNTVLYQCLLVLTSLIWGIAFVAQSTGGSAVGAWSFNGMRFILGGICMVPVIKLLDHFGYAGQRTGTPEAKKELLKASVICGIALFVASNLQQLGISTGSSAGKAGFLTTCYIVIVPLLGLFLHKKVNWNVWLAVVMALVGLYLLCIKGSFVLETSDILILLCALAYSVQILLIDYFAPRVDCVRMSCLQFLICGVLTLVPMVIVDIRPLGFSAWAAGFCTKEAIIAMAFVVILSTCVGYTLQIIGQSKVEPTISSLLMSLESVFSVLAGWLLLHEVLSVRELMGCAVLFLAVVVAQLPQKAKV